jgi:hypothetical protein
MKDFQNLIENFQNIITKEKKYIFFFEIFIDNDLFQNNQKINNINQISDFLTKSIKKNEIFFKKNNLNNFFEFTKIDIDSDSINQNISNIENIFKNCIFYKESSLFDESNKKEIFLFNIFFNADIKEKNFFIFLNLLKKELDLIKNHQNNKEKIFLFLKETNSHNSSLQIEKNFKKFINEHKKEIFFINSEFSLSKKKDIINEFFQNKSIIINNKNYYKKFIENLIFKDLFFIENEIMKFFILGKDFQINEKNYKNLFELDKANQKNLFYILKYLLKSEKEYITKFLNEIESFIDDENNFLLFVRTLNYFFINNFFYFNKKIGYEKSLELIKLSFQLEIQLKIYTNYEFKKSIKNNILVNIIKLIFN